MYITYQQLADKGACESGLHAFAVIFGIYPHGVDSRDTPVELTRENILLALQNNLSLYWFTDTFFPVESATRFNDAVLHHGKILDSYDRAAPPYPSTRETNAYVDHVKIFRSAVADAFLYEVALIDKLAGMLAENNTEQEA